MTNDDGWFALTDEAALPYYSTLIQADPEPDDHFVHLDGGEAYPWQAWLQWDGKVYKRKRRRDGEWGRARRVRFGGLRGIMRALAEAWERENPERVA